MPRPNKCSSQVQALAMPVVNLRKTQCYRHWATINTVATSADAHALPYHPSLGGCLPPETPCNHVHFGGPEDWAGAHAGHNHSKRGDSSPVSDAHPPAAKLCSWRILAQHELHRPTRPQCMTCHLIQAFDYRPSMDQSIGYCSFLCPTQQPSCEPVALAFTGFIPAASDVSSS